MDESGNFLDHFGLIAINWKSINFESPWTTPIVQQIILTGVAKCDVRMKRFHRPIHDCSIDLRKRTKPHYLSFSGLINGLEPDDKHQWQINDNAATFCNFA